ncbi:MAG: 7-carboxy-7-deazaguanine synthase QueE [Phycisphaerales bacterium]
MQTDKVNISEIFYSLQGEGFLAGVPSILIRVAGCPLRCKFCDTTYASNAKEGKKLSISQILKQIKKYPTKYVVITGGEPMVCPQLPLLCNALKKYHITVETSGIKYVPGLKCDLMSISPKLSNAYFKPSDRSKYLKIEEIQKFITKYDYQFKFVIEKEKDIKEVQQTLKKLKNVNLSKVMLMPQAKNPADYLKRSYLVSRLCKKLGFAFSPRLHIMLWGNKKGR